MSSVSGQRIARSEAEVRPPREVTIAAAEFEAVLDGDGGKVSIRYEPHRGLRAKERLEDIEVPRTGLRNP